MAATSACFIVTYILLVQVSKENPHEQMNTTSLIEVNLSRARYLRIPHTLNSQCAQK